jgi:glycosyltransferase involved in cell wall biosynthesis
MTSRHAVQALFLDAGPQMQCGVGQFALRLSGTIETIAPGSTATLTLTREQGSVRGISDAVGSTANVVCNLPIVAWKRVILKPLLALAIARLRKRRVVLIQHEWGGLHPLRRVTYLPALWLADRIVMFSPLVAKELAEDALARRARHKVVLGPLPPNIAAPIKTSDSPLRERLAAARAAGRPVIGHFGSIYPGKQPTALLDIGAALARRGVRPLIVYIGSFIRGMDDVENEFFARAASLGLKDDVIVTGFIASDAEVFGLFEQIDAFCYPLSEGLTARRSSILACVQSGRPLIVTAPTDPHEFDHHPRFKALIERGAIMLMPRGADESGYADAIMGALGKAASSKPFDFDGWWRDVAQAISAQFAPTPRATGSAPDSAGRTTPAGT